MEAPQTWGSKIFTTARWVEGAYFIQMSLNCVLSVTQAEACVEDWQTLQFAANLNFFPSSFQLSLPDPGSLRDPTSCLSCAEEEAKVRGKRGKAYPFIRQNFLRLGDK